MSGASSLADARKNRLLAALPDNDWGRVHRHLEPVFLRPGETLYEAGVPRHHAYFPTTAIVSIECPTADGASTEIALVGREGVVGIALFMGGQSRPSRGVVEARGWSFRLAENVLKEEFARGGRAAAPAAPLHAGAPHADGADGRLLPLPHSGATVVPLAAADPRPVHLQRVADDP